MRIIRNRPVSEGASILALLPQVSTGEEVMATNGTPARSAGGNAEGRLAVLIDADNAQASVIDGLLAEVAKFGVASVKRIYGDFTSTHQSQWKNVLLQHSIQPVQQFAYTTGKNATDSSMIIDAMDLMYTRRFDGFCLVTSDSDFTRLAQRLREEGLIVYGFGEQKTPDAFRRACDKFILTEVLRPTESAKPAASPVTATKKVATKAPVSASTASVPAPSAKSEAPPLPLVLLRQAIDQASDDTGWANLGPVGHYVTKVKPDFDPRLYGHKKLSDLFRRNPKYFKVEERVVGSGKALFVNFIE
jgi:hypothetical protein